jgi:hypothetical protein
MAEHEEVPWCGSILALKTGQGKTCKGLLFFYSYTNFNIRCGNQNDDFTYHFAKTTNIDHNCGL